MYNGERLGLSIITPIDFSYPIARIFNPVTLQPGSVRFFTEKKRHAMQRSNRNERVFGNFFGEESFILFDSLIFIVDYFEGILIEKFCSCVC